MQAPPPVPPSNPGNPCGNLDAGKLLDAPQALFRKARSTAASFGKLAFIGILMALLLIPMGMVRGLIGEREARRGEVEREVAGKWGGKQLLAGPILTVPYRTYSTDDKGRTDTAVQYAHFLPEDLEVLGILAPEVRTRGIFAVPVFRGDLDISGRFARPSFAAWKVRDEDVLWGDAYVTLSLPDLRSVADASPFRWLEQGRHLAPDNLPGSPVYGGLQAATPLRVTEAAEAAGMAGTAGTAGRKEAESPAGGYPFKLKLKLNGSESMRAVPMGKRTRVVLRSSWASPSFDGAYLPDARSVNASGFQAEWTTLHLSRSFPQAWLGSQIGKADWEPFGFGVSLVLPVDGYQKAERCAKYAFLFILLTFLVFFLHETFSRIRIHPLQYLFVGFALCIFYLLLLALSEHIGFGPAYCAASAAVVSLVTAYGFAILGARRRALGLMAMLAGLYGYLYTLLQMEDYALLMGSLGLFAILAAVMLGTRKVDWYGAKPAGAEAGA